MPILQAGSVNNTALIVPDLYVEIVPPQNLILNGVPTNILGVVGTSNWGPVGVPVIIGTMAAYYANFGSLIPRKYDMGTQVATAIQQGAQDFRCVRVSDGTDTPASTNVPGTAVAITALYTGSLGNQLVATLRSGSRQSTWCLSVALPGLQAEVFDNIGGAGEIFWQNLVSAVNNGFGVQRTSSRLITMQHNGAASSPSAFSVTLGAAVPGTDGALGVQPATLVGANGATRSGMQALRGQNCGLLLLADADDHQSWTEQAAFALDEGTYAILTGPEGDTIENAISVKRAIGLDCYCTKLVFGDWIWWLDQSNGLTRLVSPQGFIAGRLSNLSPEQSSLNKPVYGVLGSQNSGQPRSGQSSTYSTAELAALFGAGIDVLANPQPAGNFWGARGGKNTSSDSGRNGDNYTRLTNFIAKTLSAGMGQYVGQVINDVLFRNIRGTLLSFLQNMQNQGILGVLENNVPYSVICDHSNNPSSRTGLGYVQADVQIRYQAINEKFIINLEGGQTVQVARQTLPTSQPL